MPSTSISLASKYSKYQVPVMPKYVDQRKKSHSSDASHHPAWPVRIPVRGDMCRWGARSNHQVIASSSPGNTIQDKTSSPAKSPPAIPDARIRSSASDPCGQHQEVVRCLFFCLLLLEDRMVLHPRLPLEAEGPLHLLLLQLLVRLLQVDRGSVIIRAKCLLCFQRCE